MLPRADAIIEQARKTSAAATSSLVVALARTRDGIIAVGVAMVVLGLGFSWLIGRSITRPLNGLAAVMKRLAAGDTTARIPATQARDEIGEMARTVIVFRDTTIEREKLAQTQAETGRAREQRSDTIAMTISHFKQSVGNTLSKLRAAVAQAGDELGRSQQVGRHDVGGGGNRRTARHRRLRQRHQCRGFGRGTGRLDRRDRHAGGEIDRRRRAARCRKPSAPSPP